MNTTNVENKCILSISKNAVQNGYIEFCNSYAGSNKKGQKRTFWNFMCVRWISTGNFKYFALVAKIECKFIGSSLIVRDRYTYPNVGELVIIGYPHDEELIRSIHKTLRNYQNPQ